MLVRIAAAGAVLLASASFSQPVFAQQTDGASDGQTLTLKWDPTRRLPDLKRERVMDGIAFPKYERFWETWHLVNVRYRNDNHEQRFVYANPLAWKTMTQGKTVYPDGAMFGKIAFQVKADPAFPVSEEPLGFVRVQLMSKNAKKYKETDGWGYALLTSPPSGSLAKDDRKFAESCHACHVLAKDRGFVFTSSPFMPQSHAHELPLANLKDQFKTVPLSALNEMERKVLGYLEGPAPARVQYHARELFTGWLSETAPPLARYAADTKMFYLLSDPDDLIFLGTRPVKGSCNPSAQIVRGVMHSKDDPKRPVLEITTGKVCGTAIDWGNSQLVQ